MSKISPEIQKAVDNLVAVMCESEEFKEYEKAKESALSDPDKLSAIKRSQEIRARLHAMPESEKESDWADQLVSEYEELMENTAVYRYAHAEVAIGEICRDVFKCIVDTMEF